LYPSWPVCVHAMIMMIAGYILDRKSMTKLTVYVPEPGRILNAVNKKNIHRRQYTKPDSIRSASTFSARTVVVPFLRCALTFLRYSHAFQAMSDVDKMFVPSIGPTTIDATLPSSMPFPA